MALRSYYLCENHENDIDLLGLRRLHHIYSDFRIHKCPHDHLDCRRYTRLHCHGTHHVTSETGGGPLGCKLLTKNGMTRQNSNHTYIVQGLARE